MVDVFIPTVLIAGATDKAEALRKLSVRLFVTETGRQAIEYLRRGRINTVISKWELVDIGGGQFLKNVIAAKPGMPTVAIVKAGDDEQEVAARSIGVSAVLREDIDDDYFRDIVSQLVTILGTATADKTAYEIEGVRCVVIN